MHNDQKLLVLTKRTFYLLLAIFIHAVAFNLLIRPNHLIIGGLGGIGLILEKAFDINVMMAMIFLSSLLLLISFFVLKKQIVYQTLLAAIVYPIFINLTYNIQDLIVLDYSQLLVIAIFAGIMLGTSEGILEKSGFLSGGTDLIARFLIQKFKLSAGNAILIVEGIILVTGIFIYGIEQFSYAIVVLYIMNLVGSKIMLNISNKKVFYVYTDDVIEIKNYIHQELGYDVTELENNRKHHQQSLLMTVVRTKDYFLLKEGILEIDPHAKVMIFDSYEYFERKNKKVIKGQEDSYENV